MIIGLWALLQIASQLHARKLDLRGLDARAFDRELEQDLIELNQRALDEHRLEQRVLEAAEPKAHELEGYDYAFEAENEINTLQKKGLKPTALEVYKKYCWIREAFQPDCPTEKNKDNKDDSRHDGAITLPYAKLTCKECDFKCKAVEVPYNEHLITVAYLPKNVYNLKKDKNKCLEN